MDSIYDVAKRNKRSGIGITTIGIICIALFVFFLILIFKENQKDDLNMKNLNDNIEIGENVKGQKAYIDVLNITGPVVIEENSSYSYYCTFDGHNYNIVYISNKEYDKISQQDLSNHPYRLIGTVDNIPTEVKTIIINDLYNNTMTEQSFIEYFGKILLTQKKMRSEKSETYVVMCMVFSLMGLLVTWLGINTIKESSWIFQKFNEDEIEKIEHEMNSNESRMFKKMKTCLTPNYLVTLGSVVYACPYSEIIWMYLYKTTTRGGLSINQSIKAMTKDGKKITFAFMVGDQKDDFEFIWNTIVEKNPNIALGFTSENIKYFNAYKKQLKKQ